MQTLPVVHFMKRFPALHPVISHFCILAVCFFLSWLVMCLIFPGVFVFHTVSFLKYQPSAVQYVGVFTLVTNFFHGGVQLWNPYDQRSLASWYLAGTLTSFASLVTALTYSMLSRFFLFPGIAFHELYSYMYYLPSIGIAGIGTYLQVGRFTSSSWIRRTAMIAGATLYMPVLFSGASNGSLYSFFPLMMHLVLRMFETRKLTTIYTAILLFSVCLAMNFTGSGGDFFWGVFFVFIGTLGWHLFLNKNGIGLPTWMRSSSKSRSRWISTFFLYAVLEVLLLIPVAWFFTDAPNLLPMPGWYTHLIFPGSMVKFFPSFTFFDQQGPGGFGLFTGYALILLSLFGVIFSKDSRKYIFLFAICSFFPSSFLLVPLGVMGAEVLRQTHSLTQWRDRVKLGGILLFLILLYGVGWFLLTAREQDYVAVCMLLTTVLIWLSLWPVRHTQQWRLVIIGLLLMSDVGAYRIYYQQVSHLTPLSVQTLDYQNPLVLPLRRYRNDPRGFLQQSTEAESFLRFTPLTISADPALRQDNHSPEELVFFADVATIEPGALQRLVDDSDQRHIITVDRPTSEPGLSVPTLKEAQLLVSTRKHIVLRQWKEKTWHLKDGKKIYKQGQMVYLFHLPETFPRYITSSVFTQDQSLMTVTVGKKDLQPVQGELDSAFSYDVGNLVTEYLSVSLPLTITDSTLPVTLRAVATYTDEVTAVDSNQPDGLAFTYQAPADGWIVLPYPYDPKWQVMLDNLPVPTYRANAHFVAIPVREGEHSVAIVYWPHTWLRWLLGISMILILVVPLWIIGQEVREEAYAI